MVLRLRPEARLDLEAFILNNFITDIKLITITNIRYIQVFF